MITLDYVCLLVLCIKLCFKYLICMVYADI